jgi:ribosomal protein S18 acetylase RimI-like enzyme
MVECAGSGWNYAKGYAPDERFHRRKHDEVVNGSKAALPDGCHFITHSSLIKLQRLAYVAANAALHETRYDHISFYPIKKKFDEDRTIVAISVRDQRVCGYMVSRERLCQNTARLQDFVDDGCGSWRPIAAPEVEGHRRRALDMVWVLKARRRQGVARELVQALAHHCETDVAALAHMIPFKEDALQLWRALGLDDIFVV